MEDPVDAELITESPTPKPTTAPGCSMGDSHKVIAKRAMAMATGKCADKGCSWLVLDEPKDCAAIKADVAADGKSDSVFGPGGDKNDARLSCHWICDGVLLL